MSFPLARRAGASLAVLSLTSLTLAACGSGDAASSDGPTLVASAYPFAFVLERVGGDAVEVQNLTSPGAEPHDLELSPRQIADLSEADLLVYETGFQPAVDDGLAEVDLPSEAVLEVAEVTDAKVTGFAAEHEHAGEEHADEPHADEHTDEHAGEEHADEPHADEHADEHTEGEIDPHVWLDPARMIALTEAVEERLVTVDPDNATAYQDNAEQLTADLEALDAAFSTRLESCERRTIVTGHAAFAYLADRYDLTQVPIAGIDPSAEPTPAQQAEVADLVEEEGITTVFTEALVSPAVAESIADETGVQVARLDPIEGLSDDTADQTYLTLMEANLAAIEEANSCS